MTRRRHSAERGMTLIEVLVAFAILAGVVVGVMGLIGQNTNFIIAGEERMLAGVAADNLLTETLASRATPDEGETEGETAIGDRRYLYTETVIDLSGEAFQIEYAVRSPDSAQVLARASALKAEQQR